MEAILEIDLSKNAASVLTRYWRGHSAQTDAEHRALDWAEIELRTAVMEAVDHATPKGQPDE